MMDFFEVINKRRSIRKFDSKKLPDSYIEKALEAAILAPNSSNTQTWNFHWIKSPAAKQKVSSLCLNQSAARTASDLIVVSANPKAWKRSQPRLIDWTKQSNAPKQVLLYYTKLVPFTYRWGLLNSLAPLKWLLASLIGLFRPMARGPFTRRDVQEVAIKSAALAAENFVLAITAQGGASCMMEGFDENRLKRFLKLSSSERILMVIGVGHESESGTWGHRFRIPTKEVVHIV